MLGRVYSKKKRPLLLTNGAEGDGGSGGDFGGGMPRPVAPATSSLMQQHHHHQQQQQQQQQQRQQQQGRSHPSRMTRAFGGGPEERRGAENQHKKHSGGLVKKVFGSKKDRPNALAKYGGGGGGGGGVMYSEADECDFDDEEGDLEDLEDDDVCVEGDGAPQVLRHRRRFVRSGLTTYEQWISKNAMGRRFSRRATLGDPSSGGLSPLQKKKAAPSPHGHASVLNRPHPHREDSGDGSSLSSLSTALQEVINSRPTALKSVVDPTAGPPRVQKSFVVEQDAAGDYFVASRRGPAGPHNAAPRQTMDDSFLGRSLHAHSPLDVSGAAMAPPRRSDMDLLFRQKWGASAGSGSSGSGASAASLLSMSKAGVRRRLSGADRMSAAPVGADSLGHAPTAMAGPPMVRRSSNAGKTRESAAAAVLNQVASHMAVKYMDHMRQRSSSRSSDGLPPNFVPARKESTAMLLQGGSFEDVDALPMTMDDLTRKSSIDKGPMTMDEFMFDRSPPPPPPLQRKGSSGKSSRAKRSNRAATEDDEEEENLLSRSFRNLKDVDALKRSRSMEDEDKVVTTNEETETEEEYPDCADERVTDDLGSSYEDDAAVRVTDDLGSSYEDDAAVRVTDDLGSSYEDDAATRSSNITEFLGGFKSRTSLNRNSLAARPSLARNSTGKNDFVSRAARSLRNSRKAAQETAKVSSELSRKLREARARVPADLRGDPPAPQHKKRGGFLGRDGKRVRFDMTRYCREFEVVEPEESEDDHEVESWSQRDSEQDDDEEDEDEEGRSTDDDMEFGVPVPGAVLAAAMADANAYYSTLPPAAAGGGAAPPRFSGNHGRVSLPDDKRVSVVSRRSNANQFEVFM